jgi:hypothetical protein
MDRQTTKGARRGAPRGATTGQPAAHPWVRPQPPWMAAVRRLLADSAGQCAMFMRATLTGGLAPVRRRPISTPFFKTIMAKIQELSQPLEQTPSPDPESGCWEPRLYPDRTSFGACKHALIMGIPGHIQPCLHGQDTFICMVMQLFTGGHSWRWCSCPPGP